MSTVKTPVRKQHPLRALFSPVTRLFSSIFNFFLDLFDRIIVPLQRAIGVQRMGYFFVLPNLLIFGIFILLPMLLNFSYAFTTGDSILPENRELAGANGLQNIEQIFTCDDFLNPNTCREDFFWRAAANTVVFVVFQVSSMLALSLITALALNRKILGRAFFRSVFFYPVLLSPVVVALVWKWILQENGLLNSVLRFVAVDLLAQDGFEKINFLADSGWATLWVVVVSVWAQMGFYTLILLAGLQSIPASLYEAAQIDGANVFNQFRYITWPMLMPTTLVVLVLSLIRAVQVFDQVFVLTNGGPGTATMYMVQYIYRTGFEFQNYGLAAAASLILAIVLMIFTFGQLRLNRESAGAAL